ncbi:MAG: class I SAM-dependent methyltransferase [Promethearchaeota archaeon]|nr:MAG: class I SAM-dependent methyltransferase [Candidatus Lokiarchaeota archaeon]
MVIILIYSLPRKKNLREPSMEGLDNPEVAAAFEKVTNLLPFKLLHRKVLSQLKLYNLKDSLLDVGCGSGNLIIQVAKKYPSLDLIGVDLSSEILELAKKKAVENNLNEKIVFKIGSVENLPFPDKSVDFILSTLSLHHWEDPKQAFEEIFRVLTDGGVLLIFDFRRDARKFFYGLLKFATKVVVPKALKKINEPSGSLKAGYVFSEISQIVSQTSFNNVDIKPYLAWMFIKLEK